MFNAKIEPLTSVHIGNGLLLMKDADFVSHMDRIGIIDPQKLLKLIGTGNIDKWIGMALKPEKSNQLLEYLNKRKPDFQLEDISSRILNVYADNIDKARTLKAQLHTGTGLPLIPGSSIKGAIRTALFSYLVKAKYKNKNIAADRLISQRGRQQFTDKQINEELFGNNPNTDLLRFLQIGDAEFQYDTIGLNMIILNQRGRDWKEKKGQNQLTEAIGESCEADFRIKLNDILLKKNIDMKLIKPPIEFPDSVEGILEIVHRHNTQLIKDELDFWENISEEVPEEIIDNYIEKLESLSKLASGFSSREAIMRLGHGSGWNFLTGAWAKDPNLVDDETYYKIMMAVRRKDYPVNFHFPKTRKLDEIGDMLGFVKITLTN